MDDNRLRETGEEASCLAVELAVAQNKCHSILFVYLDPLKAGDIPSQLVEKSNRFFIFQQGVGSLGFQGANVEGEEQCFGNIVQGLLGNFRHVYSPRSAKMSSSQSKTKALIKPTFSPMQW